MALPFTKMHGLGNDFVVLDGVRHAIHITPKLVSQMADRHLGIGFDQLLLIQPAEEETVDFKYRIFNADGGEVGQCGNGARCVGRFLLETGLVAPEQDRILLGTKERILEVHPHPDNQIAVNMGVPIFEPSKVPFEASAQLMRYNIEVDDLTPEIGVVNVGNPHAVLLVEDIDTAPVLILGEKLGQHPRFPTGVNVGFMQLINSNQIYLRVYERGAGETLACGSGACAAVAIGCIQGLLDREVEVRLLGGRLKVSWLGDGHPIWMTGPAETVFKGEWL